MPTTTPTWGYQPDGSAEIFDLAPGEGLPDGWHDSPACITDPVSATAEALSARAEGRPFDPPVFDSVSGFRLDAAEPSAGEAADLAGALAEIQRLSAIIETGSADNARLIAEIEAAETELDLAAKDVIALRAALTQAKSDGSAVAGERDAAIADLERVGAELAEARASLEAATATTKPSPKTK